MLNDIQPHIYDNAYKPTEPRNDDYVLSYRDGGVLLMDEGRAIPTVADFVRAENTQIFNYLFHIDNSTFFLADAPEPDALGAYMQIRQASRTLPRWLGYACAVGCQLNDWYGSRVYCGRCCARMQRSLTERAMVCPDCGLTVYPTISPAVIVGVIDGERLLLARYSPAHGSVSKRYGLIAGFAEIGETIEQTVAREVMEETGLRVKNLRFYRSQPWTFSSSLLMGFYADLDGSDSVTLQEDELSEAVWFKRSEIPYTDNEQIALTGEMIELFKAGGEPRC